MVKKISISLDTELLQKIQEQCKISKQKTSQFIALACEHELNSIRGEEALKKLFNADNEQIYQALDKMASIEEKIDKMLNANNGGSC